MMRPTRRTVNKRTSLLSQRKYRLTVLQHTLISRPRQLTAFPGSVLIEDAYCYKKINMNILNGLDFPDSSFDLVNARFLFGSMPQSAWPKLLQECLLDCLR